MDRRKFFKKVCVSGACLCGFANVLKAAEVNFHIVEDIDNENQTTEIKANNMALEWIAEILKNADENLDDSQISKIIKSASTAHYHDLNMDKLLANYVGNLEKFIHFLETAWGWKISFKGGNRNIIIADEAKSICVCPLLQNAGDKKYPAMCHCSEGFAELMFSTVTKKSVKANIASSIQRGDKTCIYCIEIL